MRADISEFVRAAMDGNLDAVRAALDRGLDPDQVLLIPPEDDLLPGVTARLAALEEEQAEVLALFEAHRPLALELDGCVGRWVLLSYEYQDGYGYGPSAAWSFEEPYAGAHLELRADGSYAGVAFEGSPRAGRWTLDGARLVLTEADTEEALEAELQGMFLIESLSDEQTGFRGEADFRYVRAQAVRGLPELGSVLPEDDG